MTKDRKILYTIPFVLLVLLSFSFLFPSSWYKWIVSIILVPVAIVSSVTICKRNILSINKKQVLLITSVTGILFIMIYYLTGLKYGFFRTLYPLSMKSVIQNIVPIVLSIIAMENIRYVICIQNKKLSNVIIFIACVLAEFLLLNDFRNFNTLKGFMNASALVLFPAVTCNLLFHYLVKRYGIYPNIIYKLITTLYLYLISFVPGVPDLLFAFVKLLLPLVVFLFIDGMYEKKIKFAIKRRSKLSYIGTALFVIILTSFIGLVSGQFGYGIIVVGSGSMAGELNKGDAVVYRKYNDQIIEEGQIIVFEKNNKIVIHRVIDIENINGENRYYTKGDANEDSDYGYIIDDQIIGVTNFKIILIGYPTIWINELFS